MTVSKLSVEDAPDEIKLPIKEFWPPEEWDNAASISFLESGWNWAAVDDSTAPTAPCGAPLRFQGGVQVTAERSIGYFQINSCNYPDWPEGSLWNARQNAGTAHALWQFRGWQPWYFSAQALGLL